MDGLIIVLELVVVPVLDFDLDGTNRLILRLPD
jgi:hypothetical protein